VADKWLAPDLGAGPNDHQLEHGPTKREYLEMVLQRTEWSFTAAAKLLNLQRSYLHEKAAALGLARPRGPKDEAG
jgi:DNA-binding NtrC family response regulator